MKASIVPWRRSIEQAQDPRHIVYCLSDCVASWTPNEVASLPPHLRRIRVKAQDDIAFWLERFVDDYCNSRAQTSVQHGQMLALLLAAEKRLRDLEPVPAARLPAKPPAAAAAS